MIAKTMELVSIPVVFAAIAAAFHAATLISLAPCGSAVLLLGCGTLFACSLMHLGSRQQLSMAPIRREAL